MHRTAIALGLIAVASTSSVSAQRFILRTPPVLKSELTVASRILAPTTVGIDNIGVFAGPGFNNEGALFYNDSFFAPDMVLDNDADGDGNPESTYYFGFGNTLQIVDAEGRPTLTGDYILATRMSATPVENDAGFSREEDTSAALGWELQYARYLTNKKRFGLLAAFGVNGVDTSLAERFSVLQTATGHLHRLILPEGMESFPLHALGQSGYIGNRVPAVIITPGTVNAQAEINPIDPDNPLFEVTDVLGEGFGNWDLRTGLYTFRVGGFYNLDVSRRFDLRVGAGLAAIVVDSYFKWNVRTLPDADLPNAGNLSPSDEIGEQREKDILVGGWADIGASYQINPRVQFFGSVEYTSADNFEQTVPGAGSATIDTSSMINARTGFSFAF